MKTVGLLGGMSWESTALYYQQINEGIKQRLGGLHSAKIAMVSVDFHEIEALQRNGRWDRAGEVLAGAARRIEAAGADFLLICTNTMHKVAPQIAQAVTIPILHLADATADRIRAEGMQRIGLLGTQFTMEEDFYRGRLAERHGLDVIIPSEPDRQMVHRVIFDELCRGIVKSSSREAFLAVMAKMRDAGAQGIVEGCTEIVLLVNPSHTDIPLFDTTAIHAEQAVAMALE